MATNAEIDEVLIPLMDAFPKWIPGSMSSTLDQYHKALGKYPKDLLQRAADRCLDSCLDFPKIAEIVKAIMAIRESERNITQPHVVTGPFVPPPPEFYEAMNGLFKKWGIARKPRYAGLPKLPDVSPRMPYADD